MKTNQQIQDLAGNLVNREVYYNVSSLVSEMIKQEKYMEELMEVCSQPDPEGDGVNDEYYDIEALEHWIVSDRLADKLAAKGEMILKDFYGLTIWGRTCSGQAILLDGVIEDIALEMSA